MNWFTDIFIPLVCAIIGGLITLWGVKWTIRYEKEQDIERRRIELKPIFYRIDPFQMYDSDSVMELFFRFKAHGKITKEISGLFKNTDQAIIKLKYILIENTCYYPQNGNVIDKNITFEIRILTNEIPKQNKIILKIEDVLGNQYTYKMLFYKCYGNYIIKSIKEI